MSCIVAIVTCSEHLIVFECEYTDISPCPSGRLASCPWHWMGDDYFHAGSLVISLPAGSLIKCKYTLQCASCPGSAVVFFTPYRPPPAPPHRTAQSFHPQNSYFSAPLSLKYYNYDKASGTTRKILSKCLQAVAVLVLIS